MEVRRFRRQQGRNGGQSQSQSQTILPLRLTPLSNTISCWYCDFKITCFNDPIYKFGHKYARYLRVWFDVGVGFSLSVLCGVTLILMWEVVATLCLSDGSDKISNLFNSLMFGVNPSGGFKMEMMDVVYLVVSTVISVLVHEFGHAAAAASEGIQLEYIAIFLAVLFPGALVAVNYEILQAKPRFTALRIYCAGIWHNAVFCAACGMAFLVLPVILSPFFKHGEGPMVLGISTSSAVSGYMSPGDVILSLEGIDIHNAQDWINTAIFLEEMLTRSDPKLMEGSPTIKRKTYCVPSSLVEKRETISLTNNQSCPDEHFAFTSVPCSGSSFSTGEDANDIPSIDDNGHCLSSADIVKIKSCRSLLTTSESSCMCAENEQCLSPVQKPGVVWVEIVYKNPYSYQCMELEKNLTAVESFDSVDKCHKTFLHIGDVISMATSVRLTSYQPRVSFLGASLPNMLEKIFAGTFQVSVALALLNSLPVYYLDGESILEASSSYLTFMSPGRRRHLLQIVLIGGSMISCLVFLRIFCLKLW